MPRSFGTTNSAPYASAPAVGPAGDTYFNTTNKILYVSDGTTWNDAGGSGNEVTVAPDDPIPTYPNTELWYDTDAPASVAPGAGVPAGTIAQTICVVAPTGWLFLDGSVITNGQTLYPNLWSVIPAAWKSGANIIFPNASGRALACAGSGAGLTARALAATVGTETVQLTAAESGMPAHTPTASSTSVNIDHNHGASSGFQNAAHQHGPSTGGLFWANIGGGSLTGIDIGDAVSGGSSYLAHISQGGTTASENANHAHGITVNSTSGLAHSHPITVNQVAAVGASAAHNNMQPSIFFNVMIKT
jgi:microcystin-dependent protein